MPLMPFPPLSPPVRSQSSPLLSALLEVPPITVTWDLAQDKKKFWYTASHTYPSLSHSLWSGGPIRGLGAGREITGIKRTFLCL